MPPKLSLSTAMEVYSQETHVTMEFSDQKGWSRPVIDPRFTERSLEVGKAQLQLPYEVTQLTTPWISNYRSENVGNPRPARIVHQGVDKLAPFWEFEIDYPPGKQGAGSWVLVRAEVRFTGDKDADLVIAKPDEWGIELTLDDVLKSATFIPSPRDHHADLNYLRMALTAFGKTIRTVANPTIRIKVSGKFVEAVKSHGGFSILMTVVCYYLQSRETLTPGLPPTGDLDLPGSDNEESDRDSYSSWEMDP